VFGQAVGVFELGKVLFEVGEPAYISIVADFDALEDGRLTAEMHVDTALCPIRLCHGRSGGAIPLERAWTDHLGVDVCEDREEGLCGSLIMRVLRAAEDLRRF